MVAFDKPETGLSFIFLIFIALTMAALHDLEFKAADVLNANLTAPNHKMIWTVLGLEFGGYASKSAIKVRALFGLKSAGASFRAHLAQ